MRLNLATSQKIKMDNDHIIGFSFHIWALDISQNNQVLTLTDMLGSK